MVSLMLMSTWMQAIDNETTLDEAPVVRLISASDSISYDAQTNSSQPSLNYGGAENILISVTTDEDVFCTSIVQGWLTRISLSVI